MKNNLSFVDFTLRSLYLVQKPSFFSFQETIRVKVKMSFV
jgi:hypothetical protein